ncbi:MAG TPA: ATP-grasp domain-containing protein [Gaiellaceae bacterium]|nr:ATP-grasp domain-containing protein [Gaiellaceae bacterium]
MSAHPYTAAPRSGRPSARPQGQGALVIGAEYRALGIARSLGRRGIPVEVLTHGDDVLAARSRYVRRSRPLPEAGAEQQVAFLLELGHGELAGWTIFPSGDETAALVARHHALLSQCFVLTTPPWAVFRWAYDKRLTYRLASSLELGAPRTWYPAEHGGVASLDVRFPAILKPTVKPTFNRLTAAKAWRVDSARELAVRYAEACELVPADDLVVQELVPGDGKDQFSYAALCAEGRPLAEIVARRTRQYPPDFGRASTFVESCSAPEIAAPARSLLAEMRFDGLVEVEFKRHAETGRFLILDVNPRAWGWHTLGAAAGVDFSYLAWRHANGLGVEFARGRPGERWVRLSTDVPTSLKEIAAGRLAARAYARTLLGGVEGAIFARDDPVPGLLELPLLARMLVRRVARGSPV